MKRSIVTLFAFITMTAFAQTQEWKIDRYDFGMKYNSVLETGGFVIGKEVRLKASVELTKVEK